MQGIRLDQHTLEIQLTEQLLENCPLVVLARVIAGLADCHVQGGGVDRHLGNVDTVGRRPYVDPPPAVGAIEPLNVLPSHTI